MMKKLLITLGIVAFLGTINIAQNTASIGDWVWEDTDGDGTQDAGEPGVGGVVINLTGNSTSGQSVNINRVTDVSGQFLFQNLESGAYFISVITDTSYQITPPNQGGNLATNSDINQATGISSIINLTSGETRSDIDVGLYRFASIGDYVWIDLDKDGFQDANEQGYSGAIIILTGLTGSGSPANRTTASGVNGRYNFDGLPPGRYSLEIASSNQYGLTKGNQGGDDTKDSNFDILTFKTGNETLVSGERNGTFDAGVNVTVSQGCPDTTYISPIYTLRGDSIFVDYYVTSGENELVGFQIGIEVDPSIFSIITAQSPVINANGFTFNNLGDKINILGLSPSPQIPITIPENTPLFTLYLKVNDSDGIGYIRQNPTFPTEFIVNDFNVNCLFLNPDLFNPDFGFVKGRLTLDDDKNCTPDPNPQGLANWLIQFEQDGRKYYRVTDVNGYYDIGLAVGNYTATVIPRNDLYNVCSQSYNLTIVEDQTINDINFLGQRDIECASIQTNITAPFLRRCFDNLYTISYENIGTATATNATIEVELDDDLIFVNTSIPHTIVGNIVKYNIGNVLAGQKGTILLTVNVDCDNTVLGETHCVTARSYPNDPCVIPSNYSGSKIEAKAECNESTGKVKLTLTNVGTAPTPSNMQYIVTEDDVMRPPVIYQLGVQQSLQLELSADGSTYGIMTQQEANYPTASRPSAYLEGCRLNGQGDFTTGYINTFELNDAEPFVDILCLQNIGSYDPNDITGFPSGYSAKKYIEKYTKIEYLVRFQNSGSDTAFNVRVHNIIPENLDITTFSMKGASHPYTFDFINQRELIVKFKNIMLVDSNRNEALSHGYFTYEITPSSTLKDEDKIDNLADIYFDFNAPVRTNTELHTIGRPIFVSGIDQIEATIQLKAYPNPSYDRINIDQISDGQYIISDMAGRAIDRGNFERSIDVSQLALGVYQISIIKEKKHIATVSIVKQ